MQVTSYSLKGRLQTFWFSGRNHYGGLVESLTDFPITIIIYSIAQNAEAVESMLLTRAFGLLIRSDISPKGDLIDTDLT
jgi:hypothetical protein